MRKKFTITSTDAAEEWWSNASYKRDKTVPFHHYDALWYLPNAVIKSDLQVLPVRQEVR